MSNTSTIIKTRTTKRVITRGRQGVIGRPGEGKLVGLKYRFSTETDVTVDPGAGNFRLDNVNAVNVRQISISTVNRNGIGQTASLSRWHSSTTPNDKGDITIDAESESISAQLFFKITGVAGGNAAYQVYNVQRLSNTATRFPDRTEITIDFDRTGDAGASNLAGAESNDLTRAVTWTVVPDAFISSSSVVQHQDDLSIAYSQLTGAPPAPDLSGYLTRAVVPSQYISSASVVAHQADLRINYNQLVGTPPTVDLSGFLRRTTISDQYITSSSVTQHEADLSINYSQLVGTPPTVDLSGYLTRAVVPNQFISLASVAQHQADLSINYSQLVGTAPTVDLTGYLRRTTIADQYITSSSVVQHQEDLRINYSQLVGTAPTPDFSTINQVPTTGIADGKFLGAVGTTPTWVDAPAGTGGGGSTLSSNDVYYNFRHTNSETRFRAAGGFAYRTGLSYTRPLNFNISKFDMEGEYVGDVITNWSSGFLQIRNGDNSAIYQITGKPTDTPERIVVSLTRISGFISVARLDMPKISIAHSATNNFSPAGSDSSSPVVHDYAGTNSTSIDNNRGLYYNGNDLRLQKTDRYGNSWSPPTRVGSFIKIVDSDIYVAQILRITRVVTNATAWIRYAVELVGGDTTATSARNYTVLTHPTNEFETKFDLPTRVAISTGGGGGGGSGVSLTDFSVTTTSASGAGALSYNNAGRFTFAPADLSGFLTRAVVPSQYISSASVVAHQADLRINYNQLVGTAPTVDLSGYLPLAVVPNQYISSSSVAQHQADLSIAYSQITGAPAAPDLSGYLTRAVVPNNFISSASVTQHQADLSINYSQLVGTAPTVDLSGYLTRAVVPDNFISSSSVVQHQANLSIAYSQITGAPAAPDLSNYLTRAVIPNQFISSASVVAHQADLTIAYSQLTGAPTIPDTSGFAPAFTIVSSNTPSMLGRIEYDNNVLSYFPPDLTDYLQLASLNNLTGPIRTTSANGDITTTANGADIVAHRGNVGAGGGGVAKSDTAGNITASGYLKTGSYTNSEIAASASGLSDDGIIWNASELNYIMGRTGGANVRLSLPPVVTADRGKFLGISSTTNEYMLVDAPGGTTPSITDILGPLNANMLWGTNASSEFQQIDPTSLGGISFNRLNASTSDTDANVTYDADTNTLSFRPAFNHQSINTATALAGQVNVVQQVGGRLQLAGLLEQFVGTATESPTGSQMTIINRGSSAADRQYGFRPVPGVRKEIIRPFIATGPTNNSNNRDFNLPTGRTLGDYAKINVKIMHSNVRSSRRQILTNWLVIDVFDLINDSTSHGVGFDSVASGGPNGFSIVLTPSLYTTASTSLNVSFLNVNDNSSSSEFAPNWVIQAVTGQLA